MSDFFDFFNWVFAHIPDIIGSVLLLGIAVCLIWLLVLDIRDALRIIAKRNSYKG